MLHVVFTEDGVPINESAICDRHMAEFSDMAYDNAVTAEDAPEDVEFSPISAEVAANNDTVCIGCNVERQIARGNL